MIFDRSNCGHCCFKATVVILYYVNKSHFCHMETLLLQNDLLENTFEIVRPFIQISKTYLCMKPFLNKSFHVL